MDASATLPDRPRAFAAAARWPLAIGFALLAIPTILSLGEQAWSRESGAHGPIILGTGAWLVWRALPSMRQEARPPSLWLTGLLFVPSILLYVFARAFDFISLEALAVYGVGVAMLHSMFGLRALVKNWFPLFYLAFLIPPPNWLLDEFTAPLKQFISFSATEMLQAFGLPIAREGVTIQVAQYQLLVEDACSGMNSMVGLVAIGLLYIYLLRGSLVWYSLLLTALVVPIAVAGNMIRVITLILLTYYFGDQVAQSFVHSLAGFFVFAVDLVLVFLVDTLLAWMLLRRRSPA